MVVGEKRLGSSGGGDFEMAGAVQSSIFAIIVSNLIKRKV